MISTSVLSKKFGSNCALTDNCRALYSTSAKRQRICHHDCNVVCQGSEMSGKTCEIHGVRVFEFLVAPNTFAKTTSTARSSN